MIPILKAEFRKLFTIRSTYFIMAICFAFIILFSFYGEGMRAAGSVFDPNKIRNMLYNMVGLLAFFSGLVAVFLITHEYRFNTIMYTLTATASRTRIFLGKLIAVTGFTLFFLLMGAGISVASLYVGLGLGGLPDLVHQNLNLLDLSWRLFFYAWGFTMFGLLAGFLLRNMVATISVFLLLPSTIEPLMTIILKENTKYLPTMSLGQVVSATPTLSTVQSVGIYSIYLLVAAIAAWYLFVRRDAN